MVPPMTSTPTVIHSHSSSNVYRKPSMSQVLGEALSQRGACLISKNTGNKSNLLVDLSCTFCNTRMFYVRFFNVLNVELHTQMKPMQFRLCLIQKALVSHVLQRLSESAWRSRWYPEARPVLAIILKWLWVLGAFETGTAWLWVGSAYLEGLQSEYPGKGWMEGQLTSPHSRFLCVHCL